MCPCVIIIADDYHIILPRPGQFDKLSIRIKVKLAANIKGNFVNNLPFRRDDIGASHAKFISLEFSNR